MGDIVENSNSLAAPLIFIIVTVVQLIPRYLEQQIKKGSKSDTEVNLRKEIKHLYNEASALSQPSTFAQAAKLRRTAANKEKELSKYMEQHALEKQSIYDPYKKLMTPLKVLTYILLTYWFWATPVASIPKELVQPLGKMLSWKSGAISQGKVMVCRQ
ncbi:hypothetical protein V2J09_020350 [Rumex salicifolius]